MKKIKYILFTFLILSLSILSVNAECTKEEINTLKQEANKIKVTYRLMSYWSRRRGKGIQSFYNNIQKY